MLAADVLVLNHTLFFMHLGGVEDEAGGRLLFKNDFVIFDEAHTVERVASRHIGLSVSSAPIRYNLHRLWNPATSKGPPGRPAPRPGASGGGGAEGGAKNSSPPSRQHATACCGQRRRRSGTARGWSELRIRQRRPVPGQPDPAPAKPARGDRRTDQNCQRQGHGAGIGRVQPAPGGIARRPGPVF